MKRTEFESLRDLPGKRIAQDIRLVARAQLDPVLEVDNIEIENDARVDLRMNGPGDRFENR